MKEIPIEELKEKLSRYDEMTILELLEVDSGTLVEYLEDKIVEKYEELLTKLPDEEEDI